MMLIEAAHEELPEVDPIVDIYSVIAKFLNGMGYADPVVFPLSKNKFIEIQTKLHELEVGTKFFYDPKVKEFDAYFEKRLFTFIRIDNE